MLSISSGHSADYLLDAVATGRESYYTNATAEGEPAGRWYGAGAETLGLSGEVDADVMRAVYGHFLDPRDPSGNHRLGNPPRDYPTGEQLLNKMLAAEPGAAPERLVEMEAEANRAVRNNIGFYDATFSPPKSVTVVHAAFESQEVRARAEGRTDDAAMWGARRELVEEAIWVGNRAQLDYLSEHAGYTRIGHHGGNAGRWVDSHAWTVASFFQHDSRTHDPQLHIHNAILNRVEGPEGKWRTLSGQDLNLAKRGAGAVGDRAMFEHLAAESGLPSAMRADGRCRELTNVDQKVMDHFSSRSHALTPKARELAAEYERTYGRAPNAVQMSRFNQRATLATRPAKEHSGESGADRLERWDRELRAEIGAGLAAVAETVLQQDPPAPRPFDVDAVLETAVAAAQASDSRFTLSSVLAEVDATLPDYLGGLSGAESHAMLRGLAEDAVASDPVLDLRADAPGAESLPEEFRLANGASSFEQPGSRLYATREHVRSERALRAAAVERGAASMSPELAAFFCDELAELGIELGYDQRAAVQGVLTDGAKLSALVGPAGAGKSFTVGALAKAWQDPTLWDGQQRRAFGLASSQVATEVLAGDGLETRNVSRWLATQDRLSTGSARGDDESWRLVDGDLVLIDESAMANTADITRIRKHVTAAGGKLLLTGDHRQLAAVGAGGGMGLVAGTGMSYELTEARRFDAAWEADASLRLREGDVSALTEYRKHGRVVDGGTVEQAREKAVRGYVADTLTGRDALLIAGTNEEAGGLSAAVRADLVRLGRVDEAGVAVGRLGAVAGVGDVVAARRNAWDLAGFEGNRRGPINREQYRVTGVRGDGSLVVDHVGERMVLPASYLPDVELGYASTVHSAQGLTVDACHTVAGAGTGPQGFYVGMTRGRDRNTAYVTTVAVPPDSPPGAAHDVVHRDPVAVLAGAMETAVPDRAALEELEASQVEMGSVMTAGERFAVVAEAATAGRTAALLDKLTADGALTEDQRRRVAADQGMSSLVTVLRQAEVAGHDPQEVLTDAVGSQSLSGARSVASVLHDRIARGWTLEPKGDSHADWVPAVADPQYRAHLTDLAAAADRRRDELGAAAVADVPQWAVEALGPVPADGDERVTWARKAGTVAAHRERTGHDRTSEALPGPPAPGQVEAYASWRASWTALGRPEADVAERECSDGALRVRVRGYERELAWQAPYVAHDLSGTSQALERERQTLEVRRAEAGAATNDTERVPLEKEAFDAAERVGQLQEQVRDLELADRARSMWYANTAGTRAAAQRAELELSRRGVDVHDESNLVIARELLEAQALGVEVDDLHRAVTDEADLTDVAVERDADAEVFADRMPEAAETALPDVRDTAAADPARVDAFGDWQRVPDVAEVADDVGRAQRVLTEIEAHRGVLDERVAEDERDRDMTAGEEDVTAPVEEFVDVDQ